MTPDLDHNHNYYTELSEEEVIDYILTLSSSYKDRQAERRLYNDYDEIPENIISLYLYYINFITKKSFKIIIQDYKEDFIFNEALVEPGLSSEEREGLGRVYDYLGTFDFSSDPNIFIDGLRIHGILYSACPYPEFGGKLRQVPVKLNGLNFSVPDASDARREFQSFVSKTPKFEREYIFKYIDECIRICARMIAIQPFEDGNKRTFRAVLNLLLGKAGIPPVYILPKENEIYKHALFKAIQEDDYREIIRFYYYKICDAIVDLSFKEYTKPKARDGKPFIILPKSED